MSEVFKLSQRKGSRMWQIRKRWPSDVAELLKGEFVVSTGEEDKRAAQQRLPLLAAEYERRVAEARAKLAAKPPEVLSEAEAHRMAADFYRESLPLFLIKRPIQPVDQGVMISNTRERLETAKLMQGRNDFSAVADVASTLVKQAGVAHLTGNADYRPKDPAMVNVPAAPVADRQWWTSAP